MNIREFFCSRQRPRSGSLITRSANSRKTDTQRAIPGNSASGDPAPTPRPAEPTGDAPTHVGTRPQARPRMQGRWSALAGAVTCSGSIPKLQIVSGDIFVKTPEFTGSQAHSFAKGLPGQLSQPLQSITGLPYFIALGEILGIAGDQQIHGSVR